MSTLVTNTITGLSTAANITIGSTPVVSASATSLTIRGEGAVQTSVQQGLAKAWLLGGDDASLTDNFNMASGTDNGTGDYSYNITNDMANATYAICSQASNAVANDPVISCNPSNDATATGSFRLQIGFTAPGTGALTHLDKVNYCAIFGDLA